MKKNEFVIMKFIKNQFVNDFLDGNIYFKELRRYAEYAEETGDNVIGDLNEAQFILEDGKAEFFDIETNQKIMSAKVPKIVFNDACLKYGAFCMFGFGEENFCEFGSNGEKNIFEFTDIQKSKLKEFGDKCAVITKPDVFIKKIEKEAMSKGISLKFDKVKYYIKNDVDYIHDCINDYKRIPYWKKGEVYRYQQEYRLVLETEIIEEYFLKIGDIRNYVEVFDTSKILNIYSKLL